MQAPGVRPVPWPPLINLGVLYEDECGSSAEMLRLGSVASTLNRVPAAAFGGDCHATPDMYTTRTWSRSYDRSATAGNPGHRFRALCEEPELPPEDEPPNARATSPAYERAPGPQELGETSLADIRNDWPSKGLSAGHGPRGQSARPRRPRLRADREVPDEVPCSWATPITA